MAKVKEKIKKAVKKAVKKEKAKVIRPPHVASAAPILEESEDLPGTVSQLAQEALDALSTATPSIGAGGVVLRVLRASIYEDIEARLAQIVDS